MPRLQMPDGALLDLPDGSTMEAQDAAARDYLSTMPKRAQAQPMDQNESVIRQAPPETWWDIAKSKALDFAETFPAMASDTAQANRNAKAAAALSITDDYRRRGVTVAPSDVEANLDRYTGHKEVRPGVVGMGLRNGLTYDEGVNLGMGALVAVGLGTAPVSTAIGLAGFEALGYFKGNLLEQTRKSYLTAKDLFTTGPGDDLFANRRTFEDGTYRNLRDFLPETASTPLKAIFDAAEFAAMGKTLHAAYGPAKIAAERAFEVATHNVITEVRGPERVFISPEKIRDIFQTGEKIGPEEAGLVSSLGLNAQQYRNAFDYGLNIEVPTAKVTRMVEKPWWGKVRELFKIDPHEAYTARTEVMGETKGTIPVAELPEGGVTAAARPTVAAPTPSGGAGPGLAGEPAAEAVSAVAGQAWSGFMASDVAPGEAAAPGLTVGAVKAELAALEAAGIMPPGINVVQSVAELPPNIRAHMTPEISAKRVMGAYDTRSRLAHLVADSLRSPSDVLTTGLHEAATHGGLHAMAEEMALKDGVRFGPSYQALQTELLNIYDSRPAEALDLAQRYGIKPGADGQFTPSQKAMIAEELVAAHVGEPDKWTDRYIAAIQRWIREIAKALGKTWDVSQAEVRDLLRRAKEASFRRAAGQGQPQGLGPSAERVTASFAAKERTPEEIAQEISATPLYPDALPPAGSPDMAYLTMLNEASARALESSMKRVSAQSRKAETDARQTFKEMEAANPVAIVSKIQINHGSAMAFFGKQALEGVPGGRLTKSGGAQVDLVAQENGISTDDVLAALKYSSKAALAAHMDSYKASLPGPAQSDLPFAPTALEDFQAGVHRFGGLDKSYIEGNYPPEIVAVLNAGNMLKKGGAHPEALAQQLGYADESAMLNTVYGALTETLTAEQALRSQLEASGEMARHALDSDEYAAYLDEQAKILERLLGGPRTRKAPKILDPGNPTFAELQVDESAALEAALKRAERASRDAFRAGDVEGALEQKEHQKAIVERARARREMRQEISGIKRELEKAAGNTKLPLEYQDRVAAILDSVDIRRGAQTQKRLDSLAEFLDRQEALGEDTSYIPVELIERLQKTPLSTYTIEDLRDLRSSVARLVHLGGLKNKLIASKQARDFESTVQDLVVGIFDKANLDALELAKPVDGPLLGVEQPSLFGKLRAPADTWLAQSMGPEFIVRALDGFKGEGPVHDAIWSAQKHANDAELLRLEQHREAMDRILAPVVAEGHKFFSKKYTVPGVRGLLTLNQAVSIHLNSQRPVNVDHMVRGNKLTMDEIKAVSGWLPEQYRQMSEEVWNYNESLFEDINANNIALSGERLEKTAGRYYPASMDYALSQRGNQQLAAMAAGEKLQESPYIRPGTRASFRERATGGNQPLKLDVSVWVQHLMAEAVDTTRTLAARDTSRLLMDQRVKQAITLARGEDEYNALVSWVKVQRDTGRPRMDSVDKLMEGLRGNFTTAQLVLNVGNILQQPFSLLNVASEPGIGPLDMAWGISNYVANPNAATAFASSKSAFLRNRISFDTMAGDRELAAMAAKANALDAGLIAEAKRLGFYPTVVMDRVATVPTWNIGYRRGMLDSNGDEAKAIDYADSLVARTQSSSDKLHRPELMNAQGWRRFVTMFMTWQMAYTNQFRENVGRVMDQPSAENILQFTKYVFWALMVQTALTSPMQYGRLPDKKELAKDILAAPARGIPIVGPLVNTFGRMAIGAYAPPYSASPLERIPQGMVDLGSAMKSNTAGSGTRAWMEALELGSYATGVPVAPVTKAVRAVQEKRKTGKGNVLNLAVPRQRELKK